MGALVDCSGIICRGAAGLLTVWLHRPLWAFGECPSTVFLQHPVVLLGMPLTRRLQTDSVSQGPPLDPGRHWPLPSCQWKCNTHWGNSTHFRSFPDMRSSSHSVLLTSNVCSNGSLCVSQILGHVSHPSGGPLTGDKEKPSLCAPSLSTSLFPEPQLD